MIPIQLQALRTLPFGTIWGKRECTACSKLARMLLRATSTSREAIGMNHRHRELFANPTNICRGFIHNASCTQGWFIVHDDCSNKQVAGCWSQLTLGGSFLTSESIAGVSREPSSAGWNRCARLHQMIFGNYIRGHLKIVTLLESMEKLQCGNGASIER